MGHALLLLLLLLLGQAPRQQRRIPAPERPQQRLRLRRRQQLGHPGPRQLMTQLGRCPHDVGQVPGAAGAKP